MIAPRTLSHPGPTTAARFAALPCRAHPLKLRLRSGMCFEQAVVQAFAEAGFSAGYLRLVDVPFETLSYVIPAPAPGDGRAAWYSATRVLKDAMLTEAGLHLGVRDAAPFLHCHGLWRDAEGLEQMGHLLGPDSTLHAETFAFGWGLDQAALETRPDRETGFDLFAPTPRPPEQTEQGHHALLCTLRPNEDPHQLLAEAGKALGNARIEGIGSLVDTHFSEGSLTSYATEVLIQRGTLSDGQVDLQTASVGFDGTPMAGLLAPNANRICITAEMLLIAQKAEMPTTV